MWWATHTPHSLLLTAQLHPAPPNVFPLPPPYKRLLLQLWTLLPRLQIESGDKAGG